MQPEVTLQYSQDPATCPYPGPRQSSPPHLVLKTHSNMHLRFKAVSLHQVYSICIFENISTYFPIKFRSSLNGRITMCF